MLRKINQIISVNAFLLILATLAIAIDFDKSSITKIYYLLTALTSGTLIFLIGTKLFKKQKQYRHTLTTILIIFLLIHPFGIENLWHIGLITALAVTYKFLPRKPYIPYFNPAALALVLTYFIFQSLNLETPLISWWGASFSGYTSLILILIWLALGITKHRKYPAIFTFLITLFLLSLAHPAVTLNETLFIFKDSTIYFFTAIMLIDPKSSPILKQDQIFFGLIAATAYFFLRTEGINNFELLSILIANLYLFAKNQFMLAKRKQA
ncbi:hypothetical protein CVV38_00620 [Candidatus Peregrinibacteria bacterium HGW-Peregrinibacteria-1]|jgi:hypothetical protein|nr:MAG: hypothetical protein CVV38_00620 [Candidatus Peregrinibacteria bacterium HGW-Peregrinibacteria-1]